MQGAKRNGGITVCLPLIATEAEIALLVVLARPCFDCCLCPAVDDFDDNLEDEDYDLIEENLGVKVQRVSICGVTGRILLFYLV